MMELLVSLFILIVIMVGVAGLLESSWQSFSDLKWQNRVDSEARRALDAISDSVRLSGAGIDSYSNFNNRLGGSNFNIDTFSTHAQLNLSSAKSESYRQVNAFPPAPVNYLARTTYGADDTMAAIHIKSVDFAYEYREISQPNDTQFNFDTVQDLAPGNDPTNGKIFYTVKTVYITVTASFNPYPGSIDSRTYTRTLTGAVTMRAPYNAPMPPSQINGY